MIEWILHRPPHASSQSEIRETGRWEGAGGDDPFQQLNTEWQGVIHGIRAKGNPPYIVKALCVPTVDAPAEIETHQGIPPHSSPATTWPTGFPPGCEFSATTSANLSIPFRNAPCWKPSA